jgi:hypothetical protein
MYSLSKPDDPKFSRRIWFSLVVAVGASMGIAILLVLMGLIAAYGREYNW